MQQTDVNCNNCECYIEDAKSIIRVNQVNGCISRPSAVTWHFYGHGNKYLAIARGTGCCNASLRVSYIPVLQSTTQQEPEQITTEGNGSARYARSTESSVLSTHDVSTNSVIHKITSASQETTSARSTIQNINRVGSPGSFGSREILYGGLAGACALFLIMLLVAILCVYKKYGKRSGRRRKATLRESSSSTTEVNSADSRSTSTYNLVENNNVKSNYEDFEEKNNNNYFVIEKDDGFSKTVGRYSIISGSDVNATSQTTKDEERAYFVLENLTTPSEDRKSRSARGSKLFDEPERKTDKSGLQDTNRKSQEENGVGGKKTGDIAVYHNLFEKESTSEGVKDIYNKLDISNDDYDHLWSANRKENNSGHYELFTSSDDIVINENSIYF